MPPALAAFLHLLSASWQRLAAVVGIAFGVGLVSSLITTYITTLSSGTSNIASSYGVGDFGTFLAMSVQVLQMAHGGVLTMHVSALAGMATGSVSLMLMPWFTTILIVAAAAVSARFLGPKGLSLPIRGAWALVAGLAYAVIVTVIGAVVPVSVASVTVSATGVLSFFGAVLFVAGGTFLGFAAVTLADLRRPWVAAFASVVAFMVAAAVVVLLVFVVQSLFNEPKSLAIIPLLGPILFWWGTVIAGAGTVSIDGSLSGLAAYLPTSSSSFSLWSGNLPGWAWVSIAVFLVFVVGSGILAGALSRPDQRTWYRIPVAWVSVSLLLQLVVAIRFWSGGSAGETSASVSGAVGAAAYTFLIFGLWSALAAASAQYLTAHVIGYLPAFLRQGAVVPPPPPPPPAPSGLAMDAASVPPPTPAEASESTTVLPNVDSAVPPSFVASVSSQSTQPTPPPMAPAPAAGAKLSPGAKTGLFIGLGVLGLVIVAAVAGAVVRSTLFSPQARTLAFMSALEQGHAKEAAGALGAESSPLFSDEIYKAATNRPSKASVTSSTVAGDTATVTVSYTRSGETQTANLMLNRTGTDWLIADHWVIVDGAPGMTSMEISWPSAAGPRSFAVNGVDLPAVSGDANGSVRYEAFPGTYSVEAKADANFNAEKKTWDTDSSETVEFGAEPTEALKNSLIAAVRTRIAECAKSTDAVPANCPFSVASSWSASSYSNVSYRIGTIPDLTVSLADYGGGWQVGSDTYGVVYKSYTYTGYFDSYPTKNESGSYYVSARVTIENGTPNVTFS